ncbi:hypothetical protein [Streptomyces carpinensis]|uniref:Secreted protein n=1 Tax=Streptomyces carpinensis TaxID=66369 RepID=A0ABV1W1U8_9ACTN|nr:hypothetical protein [Streptomyces carpinensis]
MALLALILSAWTIHALEEIALKQQELSIQQQIPKVYAYVGLGEKGEQDWLIIENHEARALIDVRFVFVDPAGEPVYEETDDYVTPCTTDSYELTKRDDTGVSDLDYVTTFRYLQRYWKQPGFGEVQATNKPQSIAGAAELHFSKSTTEDTPGCG